jgi:hypothetical protein
MQAKDGFMQRVLRTDAEPISAFGENPAIGVVECDFGHSVISYGSCLVAGTELLLAGIESIGGGSHRSMTNRAEFQVLYPSPHGSQGEGPTTGSLGAGLRPDSCSRLQAKKRYASRSYLAGGSP